MAEKNYDVSDYGDNLRPADRIKIEHSVYIREEQTDISELAALPAEQLQTMRGDSAAAEQKIFESLREATKAWDAQAAQTLLLDKAIEYVRTPPVKHTANKWEREDNGYQSISNAVYQMNYHIYENTQYNKATQKSVPVAWDLTWSVRTNTPDNRRGTRIAGQDRKRFGDKSEMEKYLNGRIKAHANLFTELSPPVPQEYVKNFSVNGKLLPGYTLAGEVKQAEQTPPAHETERPELPAVDMDATATHAAAPTIAPAPFVLVSDNSRDKLKEITGKLEAGIKGIFESEQYKTYLKTLSKFHNYSMNNCLLIAFQKPDATRVAGFVAWRDDFKRPVMKGQKGIKIIAPAPFKTKKEMERIDPNTQRPAIGRDGKPIREEVEITIPAFKVTSVFDVSQTDGEPLPQIGVDELTGSVDRYKEFFAALEKSAPFPIAFEKITSGAKGYCNYEEKRIAINEGMSELQNLKTAIHEITHARLHRVDKDAPKEQQPRIDQRAREVQAESVAYTVCQHYGLDTSDYSFGYVATWSGDKELDVLKASLEAIHKEADAIITEIDGHLADLQKSREQTADRQPGYEEWSEPATPENAADNPGVPSDDIRAYLPGQTAPISGGDAPEPGDSFTIYQLKDGDETRDIRFEPYNKLLAAGLVIDPANYDKTYSAPLDNSMTLDKIYFAFNTDRPEGFTGHSLSMSDVIVLNKDGKETAFYVDSKGFQEVPEFVKPAPPPFDLKPVADYLQKLHDRVIEADPNKTQGVAAFNMAIKRLNQANERIPETQPQLKALIANAAQSPDLPTLKERVAVLQTEFTQHYATPAPAAGHTTAQPATKTEYGANVAAIEAQVKAGQTVNLSDLADAIKNDKTAAPAPKQQPAKRKTQSAAAQKAAWSMAQSQQAWDRAQGKSDVKPAAKKSTPIHDDLKAGKAALSAQKNAPQRVAAKGKNAGLGD